MRSSRSRSSRRPSSRSRGVWLGFRHERAVDRARQGVEAPAWPAPERGMSTTSVLTPTEFEGRLEKYLYERSEEGRAVRVGEKETSEQAEIVRRYADLFSREQLDALRDAEERASGEEQELLYRLRKTCEGGLVSAALVEKEDELENRLLAERVTFRGDEMPLRNAQAQLAVLPAYRDRDELGELQAEASASFNPDRLELLAAGEELSRELSGIADAVERN